VAWRFSKPEADGLRSQRCNQPMKLSFEEQTRLYSRLHASLEILFSSYEERKELDTMIT